MMNAVIIDDEPLARSLIREYLTGRSDIRVIDECNDGFEGVKSIAKWHPDLVFLDIQMPKINGFEMLELIENPPSVIFTTAFDEYAIKAFEAHAVDYLLKPFTKERFSKALEKVVDQNLTKQQKKHTQDLLQDVLPSNQIERVVVRTSGKIKIIPINEIRFVEAADDYIKIHCAEGSFLKNKTMSYMENSLPPQQFVRTHRSYILNVKEITRIDPYEKENHIALLKSGERIPVSKNGYGRLKIVLGI